MTNDQLADWSRKCGVQFAHARIDGLKAQLFIYALCDGGTLWLSTFNPMGTTRWHQVQTPQQSMKNLQTEIQELETRFKDCSERTAGGRAGEGAGGRAQRARILFRRRNILKPGSEKQRILPRAHSVAVRTTLSGSTVKRLSDTPLVATATQPQSRDNRIRSMRHTCLFDAQLSQNSRGWFKGLVQLRCDATKFGDSSWGINIRH